MSDPTEDAVVGSANEDHDAGPSRRSDAPGLGDLSARARREEEIATLWAQWRETRDLVVRNRLVEIFYPIAVLVSRQMASTLSDEISIDDLEGYAAEGLLNAIEHFDATRGVQFSTFAPYRIRGAVYDRIREFDWVSRADRKRQREARQVREDFFFTHHRAPSIEEEAALLGASRAAHESLVARLESSRMRSLHARRSDGTAEIDVPDGEGGPLASLLSSEMSVLLRAALEELDPRERQVIMLTYVEERSLSEAGRSLGVTESRICQIRARALRSLRRSLSRNGITEAREEMLA